jgi:hypothetical protein
MPKFRIISKHFAGTFACLWSRQVLKSYSSELSPIRLSKTDMSANSASRFQDEILAGDRVLKPVRYGIDILKPFTSTRYHCSESQLESFIDPTSWYEHIQTQSVTDIGHILNHFCQIAHATKCTRLSYETKVSLFQSFFSVIGKRTVRNVKAEITNTDSFRKIAENLSSWNYIARAFHLIFLMYTTLAYFRIWFEFGFNAAEEDDYEKYLDTNTPTQPAKKAFCVLLHALHPFNMTNSRPDMFRSRIVDFAPSSGNKYQKSTPYIDVLKNPNICAVLHQLWRYSFFLPDILDACPMFNDEITLKSEALLCRTAAIELTKDDESIDQSRMSVPILDWLVKFAKVMIILWKGGFNVEEDMDVLRSDLSNHWHVFKEQIERETDGYIGHADEVIFITQLFEPILSRMEMMASFLPE